MTTIEHIGIAVEDAEAATALLGRLLGLRHYKTESVEREGVVTHFLGAGHVKLELLESIDQGSPVARFLSRSGEGVHHLAFEVSNVDEVIARARDIGLTPLSAEGQQGADRKRIAFFHPRDTHGLLIEVCESVQQTVGPGVVSFGVPRSPAIAIVSGPEDTHRDIWLRVAEYLETQFYVVVVEDTESLEEALEGLTNEGIQLHFVASPARRDGTVAIAAQRSEASATICDLGRLTTSVVPVIGASEGREYSLPAVRTRSAEPVRLLARLLAWIASGSDA